jgi:hypothetical protein
MNLVDRLLGQDIKTHAYSDVTAGSWVPPEGTPGWQNYWKAIKGA